MPRLRPSLVPRPHLIEKLNQGLRRKLTLISAPALRYAQLADAPPVDGYLLFAPHLGTDAPTMRQQDAETATSAGSVQAAAAYSQLHVPRLIGLIMLNNVGIKALNHLDTLYFNLTDEATHTYSFGATVNSSFKQRKQMLDNGKT